MNGPANPTHNIDLVLADARREEAATTALLAELADAARAGVGAAGLQTRMYVRGGLDSRFVTVTQRDLYAKALARVGHARLAAYFVAGWVEHRPEAVTRPTGPAITHRSAA